MPELTERERGELRRILASLRDLRDYLQHNPPPGEGVSLAELQAYLAGFKAIQGNAHNGASLVATLLAKEFLFNALPMRPFDAALKPQGAPGLDIDEATLEGARVVAEIKTTVPYQASDLGAAQAASFKKDFEKLNATAADHRFFFVTDRRTYAIVQRKYRTMISGTHVVLLPEGESFVA